MRSDFKVGDWVINPSLGTATHPDGTAVQLEPRTMGVLVCLAEHAGEVMPKERIIEAVWPDERVDEEVLAGSISSLQKAFRDDIGDPRVIRTIQKRGYQLIAPLADSPEPRSRYRIVGRLGEGRMGEVHLANDLSLNRKVAIKFLIQESQSDELLRRSLLREARSAAALDHPYICTVHEVGQLEGRDFIAMEYLDGQTLKERIAAGPVPLEDALQWAREMAEALAHAHSRGIVHRDLKPSNIMVTASGHIKLTDFGLAKRIPVPDAAAETQSLSAMSTGSRVLVGTPVYMAPEQLVGQPASPSSDIFAFGIVLYEMVAGVHPFQRAGGVSTQAILHDSPRPLQHFAPGTPAALQRVVDKMLAKDHDQRYRTASDVLRDIAAISGPRPVPRYLAAALILVILAAVAGIWIRMLWRGSSPAEAVPSERVLVAWQGTETDATIAPDGKWFSFLSSRDGPRSLYIGKLAEGEPERVESLSGVPVSHAWSPDSNEMACVIEQGGAYYLQVVPAGRLGTPVRSYPFAGFSPEAAGDLTAALPTAVAWFEAHVYIQGRSHLWVADRNTGELRRVTRRPDSERVNVSVRSDERRIAFDKNSDIWIADLDGENASCVLAGPNRDFDPIWFRTDGGWHLAFASNRNGHIGLWEYSLASRGVRDLLIGGMDRRALEASTPDGSSIIYDVVSEPASLWCWDPPTGASRQLTGETLGDYAPAPAAHSNLMAFEKTRRRLDERSSQVDTEIWLGELRYPKIEQARRIVESGLSPRLSPDGSRMAYLQFDWDRKSFSLCLRDLSSQVDTLISSRALVEDQYSSPRGWGPDHPVWSAGGDLLLYIERADQASSTLKAYSVQGNQSSLLVSSRPGERIGDPRLSRDGRSLIYSIRRETRSERQWEIRQRSLPAGEERTIYSESGRFRLHNLGWLGESVLAVKQYFPLRAGVNTGPVEILRLEPGGSRRTIQKFDLAYGHTAVLDADRGVLYLTVIEDGLSNIRAFFPATGRSIRLTDNQRREMTFAGLQVCGAGRLLYSHHGVISDLYLLERRH